jgi:subtilisin family serine protease
VSGKPDLPPWRRPPRGHFPGVPAWGTLTAGTHQEPFDVSLLPEISTEWGWGGSDGSGIRVCVVDSGVEAAHPLVGGVEASMSVVDAGDGVIGIAEVEPVYLAGHGTACASVIRSIAPGASITSRVLTDGTRGSGPALLAGLEWALDQGFDVVNMSLSTTKEQFCLALHELADRAYFRRSVLVASAHNMPVRSYPWPFASVISVASHNEPDPMVYYYNPTPPVEFYARGVKVRVAWRDGREISSTGNSFATPHIAGICALILSKHPLLTPFQLKAVLYLSAANVTKSNGGARDAQ